MNYDFPSDIHVTNTRSSPSGIYYQSLDWTVHAVSYFSSRFSLIYYSTINLSSPFILVAVIVQINNFMVSIFPWGMVNEILNMYSESMTICLDDIQAQVCHKSHSWMCCAKLDIVFFLFGFSSSGDHHKSICVSIIWYPVNYIGLSATMSWSHSIFVRRRTSYLFTWSV